MFKITKDVQIAISIVQGMRLNTTYRVAELADLVGTTEAFAQQVVRKLRKAHIVRVFRGPGGGVELARSRITMGEVLVALGRSKPSPRDWNTTAGGLAQAAYMAVEGVALRGLSGL